MRFSVRVLFAILVVSGLAISACGLSNNVADTDSQGTVSGDPPTETTVPLLPAQICPDAEFAAPELLPVGVVLELPDKGAQHVLCASYDHAPPASGAHFPAWQNCGIYSYPIQQQTAVHSLEHGAVWVAYQPDLDSAVVSAITERLESERFALVAPYPDLQNPIVLTAWRRQLAIDDWSDPVVEEFLDSYLGRYSPTAPEAGASCAGAVGGAPNEPNKQFDQILEQVSS